MKQIISETIINYIHQRLIVSRPISFFKQENSGNGHATDDENNESNKEDTSISKQKKLVNSYLAKPVKLADHKFKFR